MILGRSPNLVLGAFTAVFNVFVLSGVLGDVSPGLISAVNIAAGAIVVLIANGGTVEVAGMDARK